MDGERIRMDLDFLVLARPISHVGPIRRVKGRYTSYEDGRWHLYLIGADDAECQYTEDREEGARAATAAIISLLSRSPEDDSL